MAPEGPRKDARNRAAHAYKLRCMQRTWDEIARAAGYRTTAAAAKAVRRHIARMPAEDQQTARALSAGNYRMVIAQLYEIAAAAKSAGRTTSAVQALQTIADVQDKHDKLVGLHVVVPTKIDVTVSSAAAVLERAEAELLEIAQQAPPPGVGLPVLDAEVIG